MLWVVPADQRLGANQYATFHLRLIVEQKLVLQQGLAEITLHFSAGIDGGLQRGGEETHGISTRGLGLIHGNIGLLQDFVRSVPLPSKQGDPDACSTAALMSSEDVGLGDGREDLSTDGPCLRRRLFGNLAEVFEIGRA